MLTRFSTGGGGGGDTMYQDWNAKSVPPPRGETFGTFFVTPLFSVKLQRDGTLPFRPHAKSVFPVFDQKWKFFCTHIYVCMYVGMYVCMYVLQACMQYIHT